MRLWVGLGNPEPGMRHHRHNIGFMAVDAIAARHGFEPWRARSRGLAAAGVIGGRKVVLLKPMTYMNLSGEAVQVAASFHKLGTGQITVFHDELDLDPGAVRIKRGGGAAGHNGLRSLDRLLPDPGYWRIRLGIGHPGARDRVTGWVLGDFTVAEHGWLGPLLDAIAEHAPLLALDNPPEFASQVAKTIDKGTSG